MGLRGNTVINATSYLFLPSSVHVIGQCNASAVQVILASPGVCYFMPSMLLSGHHSRLREVPRCPVRVLYARVMYVARPAVGRTHVSAHHEPDLSITSARRLPFESTTVFENCTRRSAPWLLHPRPLLAVLVPAAWYKWTPVVYIVELASYASAGSTWDRYKAISRCEKACVAYDRRDPLRGAIDRTSLFDKA